MSLFKIVCFVLLLTHQSWAQTKPDELFTAATQAFHNGFSDVAIRYSEEFLQQFPQDHKAPEVKLLLGQSYYLANKFDQALAMFGAIADQYVKKDEISFWLAETYLKLEKYDLAKKNYNIVLEQFPQSSYVAQSMYSLGWLYLQTQEFSKAKELFKKLYTSFPDNSLSEDAWLKAAEASLNLQDWNETVSLLNGYLKQYPQSTVLMDVYYNLGQSYYNLGNFNLSVDNYKKSIEIKGQPELMIASYIGIIGALQKSNQMSQMAPMINAAKEYIKSTNGLFDEFLLSLGTIYFDAEDYLNALNTYDQIIKEMPQSAALAQAYLGRANVLFALKRYDDAALDYKKILDDQDPQISQKAKFGLAWLLLKQGQIADSLIQFQALAAQATDPLIKANALIQIADAYQDAAQFDKATTQYQEIVDSYPELVNKDYVLYRHALSYLKEDQADLALAKLAQLKEEFPQSEYLADWEYYQGVAAFKKNDWPGVITAMTNFLRALTKPSEFTPQANYILGISYLNTKQPDEAIKIFQKILRLYPDNPMIAKNADLGIARCYVDLDQIKEAQKRFKIIIYKYPKSDASFESLIWLAKNELKNNNAQQAITFYQQAISESLTEQSNLDTVYYELAQAYEMNGSSDEAMEAYAQIKKDSNLLPKAQLAIADLMPRDNSDSKAVNIYHQVITTYPNHAREAVIRLGQLYRNTQDYEKELQIYRDGLALPIGQQEIRDAQLQFNMADTFEQMSKTDEAIQQYLAIAQDKNNDLAWSVKAYLRIAKIYEEGKDWQGARVTYQKIVSLNTEESKYAQERLDWIKANTGRKK